jgi:hypothetical protein
MFGAIKNRTKVVQVDAKKKQYRRSRLAPSHMAAK